jgi:AsmA protein
MAFVGKPLKILAALAIGLLLLGLAAAAVLLLFIDPNDYKPQIIALVKEKTDRELQLPGKIDWSVFPWLGVSTGRIVLNNTRDFSDRPFATAEKSEIKVKWLPLFSRQIQVSRIVLQGLHLNLIKNQQGIDNWADLMALNKAEAETDASLADARQAPEKDADDRTGFTIDDVHLTQASLDWDNRQSGKRIEVRDLELKAENVAFEQPSAITASFRMAKAGAQPLYSFRIASNLKISRRFEFFNLTGFELNYLREDKTAPARSLAASLKAADMTYDKAGQSMKMTGITLDSGELHVGAELSGATMIDKPDVRGSVAVPRFNLAGYLRQAGFALPAMQDGKALNKVELRFDLLATADGITFEKIAGRVDDTQVKGSGSLRHFAQPETDFDLQLDALDADRYLPPQLKQKKPMTTPGIALAAGLSKLPADTLKKLNIDGSLAVNRLKINDLTLQDVRLRINGEQGEITSTQAIGGFYQGVYDGRLSLSMRDGAPHISLHENMDGVRIEPLLKDLKGKAPMAGVMKLSSRLQGQGRTAKELKSSLSGQLDFRFRDTAVKGFNLQKIIDDFKALKKESAVLAPAGNEQTVFSEISGTARLSRGLMQNDDLVADSPRFRIDGKGSANLNTDGLDYQLVTRLKKNQDAPAEAERFHSTPAVIHIGGTFGEPVYTLDISALLTEKNKAKLEKLLDKNKEKVDKLLDKLDKKLGPGAGDLLKKIF